MADAPGAPTSYAEPGSPDRLDAHKHAGEAQRVAELLASAPMTAPRRAIAAERAVEIIKTARAGERKVGLIETFLEEFGLSTPEGLALMCIAEALLRVPDADTADALIAEKLRSGAWTDHLGRSESLLVNASTWGLMLTGRVVAPSAEAERDAARFVRRMVREAGEPVIRAAMMRAMKIMGEQFVLGRTIKEALRRGARQVRRGDAANQSFDMLGEGARTYADAERYLESYRSAIEAIGEALTGDAPERASGVSVKLSALHPAYRAVHAERVHEELYPSLLMLAKAAASANIGFTLDAEEADRLVLSLELLDRLSREPDLAGWTGLGLAVQAYQKRAEETVDWIIRLAAARDRRLMVRLVKGAYWDSEIKRAQVEGHADFPVFTQKAATDASYLACAAHLLQAGPQIYPQFATHNAHTLASVETMAADAGRTEFEFQRLHGMGGALYAAAGRSRKVRVYAPVGAHQDLLPYLVRRLLENGANTSFVHAFLDDDIPPADLAADPFSQLASAPPRHPRIPAPPHLFPDGRANSHGLDLSVRAQRERLERAVAALDAEGALSAAPIISGRVRGGGAASEIRRPSDKTRIVGAVRAATAEEISEAFTAASAFQPDWNSLGGEARARILGRMADALERDRERLIAVMAREAGKTFADGIADVREAVDFCRYYAREAEATFSGATPLPGPAGETNALELTGRGVFVCISPWNFPLAIFTGQIAAALAAGNTVIAKPAEQTPIVAARAVELFLEAGLPPDALHLITGAGEVGAALVAHRDVAGVAFTGSTEVARLINRSLAAKDGPIATLIAETGGLNAMFCDTTALNEQVVDDVIASAFQSAGQRCSALRLLFLPHETADRILDMLKGAVEALVIGDPAEATTDIGPVIDEEARAGLIAHLKDIRGAAKTIWRREVGAAADRGAFFGPTIIELASADDLGREVFGPVLHVVRYDPDEVETVGAALSAKGYGLTLGVHSRLDRFAQRVQASVRAGNVYVNRSMIGAVVGVQPFGGMGLSGTGPKAGGPHYVSRFAAERTVTVNIAAQGGDPTLLNL
ncbi:bifunctional proline dehydrogenase/L-glutamate gamma-semialdehyde dehydrogenase PutA [bacterium]|nr:bifunctional proline dehydrogenase/L-glutamate gamma-semialdehyde dehydrogenase PutA [bacterium]